MQYTFLGDTTANSTSVSKAGAVEAIARSMSGMDATASLEKAISMIKSMRLSMKQDRGVSNESARLRAYWDFVQTVYMGLKTHIESLGSSMDQLTANHPAKFKTLSDLMIDAEELFAVQTRQRGKKIVAPVGVDEHGEDILKVIGRSQLDDMGKLATAKSPMTVALIAGAAALTAWFVFK